MKALAAGTILASSLVATAHGEAAPTAPAPAEPAPEAPAPSPTMSIDTPTGDIFRSPEATAVVARYSPELVADKLVRANPMVSIRFVQHFFPNLTDAAMKELNAELGKFAAPPPDLSGPLGDPAFKPQKLVLAKVPKPTGPRTALFNRRDLVGWDVWLGPKQQNVITAGVAAQRPIGLNKDTYGIFTVRSLDGGPVIRADGSIWGTLTTKREFANYHLHLEYKWGEKRTPADNPKPRNNGVLYHSYGPFGALTDTWMNSVELEMVPGQVGGLNPAGLGVNFRTSVGRDMSLPSQTKRHYMFNGRDVNIGLAGFEFVQQAGDPESAIGTWNSIDLYVVGDSAVHVVNGTPVMAVHGIRSNPEGAVLDRGKIQLQSEGAETFFRNVTIEPIKRLPEIRVAK
ncbi:DUF1080 domain-containing protein [Novosphingobium sp. BL-52-GroH]|uniref:3-keto-disaccharide hydrolase n=1 Tax=Novosphingobium sp. BL-52-GroH TaxID=3349877 RepID=UPI00384F2C78